MANWEYAFLYAAGPFFYLYYGDSNEAGHENLASKKGGKNAVILQRLAEMSNSGWELFQVLPKNAATADEPCDFSYFLRRAT